MNSWDTGVLWENKSWGFEQFLCNMPQSGALGASKILFLLCLFLWCLSVSHWLHAVPASGCEILEGSWRSWRSCEILEGSWRSGFLVLIFLLAGLQGLQDWPKCLDGPGETLNDGENRNMWFSSISIHTEPSALDLSSFEPEPEVVHLWYLCLRFLWYFW